MYVIARPFENIITLTDSKYDQEEHPDFVGPPPLHVFTLAGWIQVCIRRDVLDIGLNAGMPPGAHTGTGLIETVIERLTPDQFVWHTKMNPNLEALNFYLVEHDAMLQAMQSGRIMPVEMTEQGGELAL